jgi:uncharacterized membrane protein
LFFHVSGAFLFLGGTVIAWVLGTAAALRERPSEVALLMRLAGAALVAIGAGMVLALVFGLWLVFDLDQYDLWDGWVVGALVLFVLAGALGGRGGSRDRATRQFAERLAAEGDVPSAELGARVRDPVALAFNVASSVLGLAILALMIWKPGA